MFRRTPLHEIHLNLGARLVPFAGYEMPLQYSGVIAEHLAVRTSAGLFDVSHMGEVEFLGKGALESANRLLCNDLTRCADGQALYSGLLNERGGFIDDVVAYRFSEERILICVNSSNREKDFQWMVEHSSSGVKPIDRSDSFALLALQGPGASSLLQKMTSIHLAQLPRYHFSEGKVGNVPTVVSRTGYTGEDGFELFCAPEDASRVWLSLLEEGKSQGLLPCGLGARDTLRTEMKYPLYGNDIDENHTPWEAALGWMVNLEKDFIGKEALRLQKREGIEQKWIGFEMTEPGIPRPGHPLLFEGKRIGAVTSGTLGPSVNKGIGMGYVPSSLAVVDTMLKVEIRGREVEARVVKTPFWKAKTDGS